MTILDIIEASTLDWKETPNPEEIKICCCFCIENGESPDTRFRLGINIRTGKGHCFNCGWSSGDYVFTARSLAHAAEVDMVAEHVTAHVKRPARPQAANKPAPAPEMLLRLPDGYEAFNWTSTFERQARDYLMGRRITREQIDRWRIGYAMAGQYAGRIIIPVVHDKQLAGVACRDYTGNADDMTRMRWMNSESLRGVFGMKGQTNGIIVEGAMDALRVENVMPSEDALCLFGSNTSDDQMQFLRRYKRLTYLCDYDAPGCKGAITNCEQIAQAGIEIFVHVPLKLDGTDPGSQSDELLLKRRRAAVPWSTNIKRFLLHRAAFK